LTGAHQRYPLKNSRGFTLIEVIVALALLGITLASIMELFSSNLKASRRTTDYTEAFLLATTQMEMTLSKKIESVKETNTFGIYSVTKDIIPLEIESDTKKYEIIITVSWGNNRYELRTIKVEKETEDNEDE
jgi:prepilin-type N-terminal cleavage/methylation domain-containing protein